MNVVDSSESSHMRDVIRLKVLDPERFSTLCKMHLSFILDLQNEELSTILETNSLTNGRTKKSGFTPFTKRIRVKSGVMNGTPLTQEGICQVYQLIEYLGRDFNITQEGLFRKSGKLSRQQELKEMLNFGAAVDLDLGQYSVHECASVLKSFLADLPQPLLTEAHYIAHCKVPDLCSDAMSDEQKICGRKKQIKVLQLLFLLLPSNNRRLLQDLLVLLNRVTKEQKDNLMDSLNLAMMFAPHIMCPRKLSGEELQAASANISQAVAFMIDNASELFKVPKELIDDVRTYWLEQERETQKQSAYKALKSKFGLDSPESNGVMINTSITFCDRRIANDPSNKDATTIAVAGLYAYVQSMPDCPQKRKLVKQFNKENGYGIDLEHPPVQNKHKRSKTVGDTIQKNITLVQNENVNGDFSPSFERSLTPDIDKIIKQRKRRVNVENEIAAENSIDFNHSKVSNNPLKVIKNEVSSPFISKCNSPLARTVLRASRRVKKQFTSIQSRNIDLSSNFKRNLAPEIEKITHGHQRRENIENEPPNELPVDFVESKASAIPMKLSEAESSGPVISKYSSPLARSVLRASRRVKKAVMPSKNRAPVVLQSSKNHLV